jgi:outer membrane lipoprotein-sorting protein
LKQSFFLLCQFIFFANSGSALTGNEIVEKLQGQLREYTTFSMVFEKEFYWAALDKTRSRKGKVDIQNPNQFRVQLDNGDVMVADGFTVWSYIEHNKQVIVSDYDSGSSNPWQVFVDYSSIFVPTVVEETKIGGRSAYMLSMQERPTNQQGRLLKIWVDKKKWWLLQIESIESNGDVTTFRIKDHKVNKKNQPGKFSFVIPDSIEVLDRRYTHRMME